MSNLCRKIATVKSWRNIRFFQIPVIFLLFFTVHNLTMAQKQNEVLITGEASFAAGKEIRLIVFDDLLTHTPITVATDKISKDGFFQLQYKTNRIKVAQLAIQTSKAEFYIVPGTHYDFIIDMNPDLFQLLDPNSYGGFLQIQPTNLDTNELNVKIKKFDLFFEKITESFYPDIVYRKNVQAFDSLSQIINNNYKVEYEPLDFYKSQIFYSYGALEQIMYQKYPERIYQKYLDNEYILYDNPAYMTFFHSFYDNYLYTSPRISKDILTKYINEDPDYLGIFNEVGKDPFLVNERIRELVIIKNLGEFYEDHQFSKKNILQLLNYIKKNTRFPEHKDIVEHVINVTQLLHPNTTFPKCTLKEVSGVDFKLEKLKGKWVYLQFFTSNCEDCIREMMIIKELSREYKDSIVFVSVSLDFDFGDFSDFKQSYKIFDWQFVHFDYQFEWLDALEINSLPDNILIAPSGKLALRDVPSPEKGLTTFLKIKFTPEEKEYNPLSPHNQN